MKKCPKCGAEITDDNANACENCGVWLADVGGAIEQEVKPVDDVPSSVEPDTQPPVDIPADDVDIPADDANGMDSVPDSSEDIPADDVADGMEDYFRNILGELGNIDAICEDAAKDIPSDKEIEAEVNKGMEGIPTDESIKSEIDKEMKTVDNDGKTEGGNTGGARQQGNTSSADGQAKNLFVVEEIPDEGESECKCLLVEYNWNSFSIENIQNYLYFRLTPLSGLREDDWVNRSLTFSYWIVKNPAQITFVQIPIFEKIQRNKRIEVSVPIKELAGIYNIFFKVECITDSGKEAYVFQQQKYIVFAKEHVITDSPINIYAKASEAGDVRVKVDRILNSGLPFNEQLRELAKLPPAYGCKALKKMFSDLEYILLFAAEYSLYVIGKPFAKLGRLKTWVKKNEDGAIINGTSDLIIRIPDLSYEERPNSTVSATHGILSIFNGILAYQDTSTHGTRIDDDNYQKNSMHGERERIKNDWFKDKTITLPADRPVVINFGDIPLELKPCTCTPMGGGMCRDCVRMPGGVCSAILRRKDDVREIYLMVPYCCDLGKVLPQLAGWILYRRKGGFGVRMPNGTSCPLNIGESLAYGGVTLDAEEFVQQ